MAKSKTFRFDGEGSASVAVPGQAPISFEPGEVRTHETEDPAEIAALTANPDVSEVKKSKAKGK